MTPPQPQRTAGAALNALSPRVLLSVLLLIVGVIAMHTLGAGHLNPAPPTQVGVHRVDAMSADMGLPLTPAAAAADAAAGGSCGADPVGCTSTADAGMSDHMGAMCLAVLPTALGLALLLLTARSWTRPHKAQQARHASRGGIRAGPWPALTPPLLRTAVLRI